MNSQQTAGQLRTTVNGVRILYEDHDILVCVKPAGTACETKNLRQPDMVSLLRNYRSYKSEDTYIGLVHRLDQPVEGIVVFGKHPAGTAALARQLQQGGFSKVYLAVTLGRMPAVEGHLENYLIKDGRTNTSAISDASDPKAKKAVLDYRVVHTYDTQSPVRNLVRIQLVTGRHHQIRVQMAHLGTPLEGDVKYGADNRAASLTGKSRADVNRVFVYKEKKEKEKEVKDRVLKLCACELEFVHPVSKKKMNFQIDPSWQE